MGGPDRHSAGQLPLETGGAVACRSASVPERQSVDQPCRCAGPGLQRLSVMPFLYVFPRTATARRDQSCRSAPDYGVRGVVMSEAGDLIAGGGRPPTYADACHAGPVAVVVRPSPH